MIIKTLKMSALKRN
ncbi:hypothetical protein RWK24_001444 [Escherichia coli]|nr:hypothetical protein [Escherichia coli]